MRYEASEFRQGATEGKTASCVAPKILATITNSCDERPTDALPHLSFSLRKNIITCLYAEVRKVTYPTSRVSDPLMGHLPERCRRGPKTVGHLPTPWLSFTEHDSTLCGSASAYYITLGNTMFTCAN